MKGRLKYLIGFLIILGAFLYLLSTTFRSSLQYYVTVSEFFAKEQDYQDRTLKVAGIASDVSRTPLETGFRYQFVVTEGGRLLHVTYDGFVPDTFKNGSQVVVTGHLEKNGSFKGDEILAKCASKYEAKINTQ